MSVAGVVLAAGFSRRLGRPKQIVEIGGETLITRTVRVALDAGLQTLFVVVNARAELQPMFVPGDCVLVRNDEAEEGIAASIRAGVRAVQGDPEIEGMVLMTCDQIGMTADHLRLLYGDRARLTGSGYAGKIAVPAYFPRAFFDGLLQLRGDSGARLLLQEADAIADDALCVDVDTEEDVERAQRIFGGGS